MTCRIAALLCLLLGFASLATAQDSRSRSLIEQQLRLQKIQQQGGAQSEQMKRAMELRMLQQMRGQKGSGPQTGIQRDPRMMGGGNMQGGVPMGPQMGQPGFQGGQLPGAGNGAQQGGNKQGGAQQGKGAGKKDPKEKPDAKRGKKPKKDKDDEKDNEPKKKDEKPAPKRKR